MLTSLDKLAAFLVIAGLLAAATLLGQWTERLDGAARVVDGDTIAFGGRRVRLRGMDAPEFDQLCERNGLSERCGETARRALVAMIGAGPVACSVSGRDRFGRDLGTCEAGGRDLGRAMVEAGQAVSDGGYPRQEQDARERRVGLWAGRFERPAEWRRAHRVDGRLPIPNVRRDADRPAGRDGG